MSEKLLSIVIPTYNMEQYLPQCLDSITREDVPDTLEAIVVNDGSTDHSLEIAKRYQVKRPDIIQIIDKPNGHYGSCINAALKVAAGKYFRPLDADDWFDTNALLDFLHQLNNINTDLIITPRQEHHDSNVITFDLQDSSIINNHEINAFKKQPLNKVNGILSMHSMTFKSSLLKKIGLKLQEGICYTDTEFYFIPFSHAIDYSYINKPLYQYRTGREGQSMDQNIFFQNRSHFANVLKKLLLECKFESSLELEKITELLIRLFNIILFQCPKNKINDAILKEIHQAIMQNAPHIWRILNQRMHYTPSIWLLCGAHFYLYTKIKVFFGVKSILRN